jgi:hypothetical protein
MVAHAAKRSRRKNDVVERFKQQAGEVTELVRGGARALKEQAAETAGEWTRAAQGQVGQIVDARKRKLTTKMRRVGGAVRKGAELLQAGKVTPVAQYVELAADAVDRVSKYLEDAQPADLAEDLGNLVRRNRQIAVGTLFLIGLAVGRLGRIGQLEEERQERRRQRRKRNRGQRQKE